jgi:riboflavin kinase/FMN adenylyltransferase
VEWYPLRPQRPAVVTIGFFDGVHLGHQTLLRVARRRAVREGWVVVALTFDRHPAEVLEARDDFVYLTPPQEKLRWLRFYGAEHVAVQSFTESFSRLPPSVFVQEVLLEQCRARAVVVGRDFRFGHRRGGDVNQLRRWGEAWGFSLTVVPPVSDGQQRISSRHIRRALVEGDVRRATRWLGRPYSLEGIVQRGKGLGREWGFPTLNLRVDERKCLPAYGVYIGYAVWSQGEAWGVLNIGLRPTVHRDRSPQVEVHLLDVQEELYDRSVQVFLLERLREERRFPDVEALRTAIAHDVARTKEWIADAGERWMRRLKEPAHW